MLRHKIILLLICFGSLVLKGQINIDSLRNASGQKAEPEDRVKQYLLFSSYWAINDQDSAKAYIQKSLALSEKLSNQKYRVEALNHWANYLQRRTLADSAMQVYEQALSIAKRIDYLKGLAKISNNISIIHSERGDYLLSLESLFQSLNYEELLGNEHGMAEVFNNIGVIFYYQSDYEKSLIYLKLALDVYLKVGDEIGIAQTYDNIGGINEVLGRPDSALYYYQESLQRARVLNDEDQISNVLNNIAGSYIKKGDFGKAEDSYQEALAINEGLENIDGIAMSKFNLASLYNKQEQPELALTYASEALLLTNNYNLKNRRSSIYKFLQSFHEKRGDYKKSLDYSKNLKALEDTLFNEAKSNAIAEAETRYKSAKKDQAIAEQEAQLIKEQLRLKQKSQWITTLLFSLSILIVIALFVYRQQKLKQARLESEVLLKQERAKTELREKMEAERLRIARDLHDHIGTQLTILGSNLDKLAFKEVEEEKRTYLEEISDHSRDTMHQLRETIWAMNVDGINMKMLVAKLHEFFRRANQGEQRMLIDNACSEDLTLSPNQTIALFRICQEAANNALKHADFKIFQISFNCKEGALKVHIKDDGKGFDFKESDTGYGLANMEQRAKELKASFKFDSKPGAGFSILIEMELKAQMAGS